MVDSLLPTFIVVYHLLIYTAPWLDHVKTLVSITAHGP